MGGKVQSNFLKLVALVTFAMVITGTALAADVKLRYAHVGSEGDIQYWYADQFAKRVPGWTDGRVTVTVFPNSQMGGVQELIDGVKSGSLSLGHHQF